MTIHLPHDLESTIQAAVHSGRFASLDDAMTEAARLLVQAMQQSPSPAAGQAKPDPVLGSMRDAADELDEIVTDAMQRRRQEVWRDIAAE